MSLVSDIVQSFKKRCPACGQGDLFSAPMQIAKTCNHCGEPLADNDVGDGAAVFLIFILGATLVPMAWVLELWMAPPLWVHVVLCAIIGGLGIFIMMPTLKAYIMLLEYRHRPRNNKK